MRNPLHNSSKNLKEVVLKIVPLRSINKVRLIKSYGINYSIFSISTHSCLEHERGKGEGEDQKKTPRESSNSLLQLVTSLPSLIGCLHFIRF